MRFPKSLLQALAAAAAAPSLRWQQHAPALAAAAGALGARGLKTTTGIVGLPVDDHARINLKTKLEEVLAAVQGVPADAEYRRSVEATANFKLSAIDSDAADLELEETFGRQLEEEIRMAKDELALLPRMKEWAPWDVPAGYSVEVVEERDVEGKVGGSTAAPPPPPPPPPSPPKP